MHILELVVKPCVVTLLAATSFATWACPSPTRPAADSEYTTILLAEVVGVRLTDYADARLRQLREKTRYAWGSDASPGYEVEVIPLETLKGPAAPSRLKLQIPGGCAIPTADLQQFGLFHVDRNGRALPVYQDDPEYRTRLVRLGSEHATTCNTTSERFGPHPCWKPRQFLLQCLTFVKDMTYATRSSCPSGVQELRERLNTAIMGHYDWDLPPRDPSLTMP